MATNKNATIRYNALDKCFSNPYRKFYINDLIDCCNSVLTDYYGNGTSVSRRQVFDDMTFMKSEAGYNAPIESYRDGKKVYYRYSDKDFSILKKPLSQTEINHLKEAMETLNRLNNLQGFDWVNTFNAKLSSGLDMELQQRQIISFQENEFLKGIEFLNSLYQYIIHHQCIEVKYQGYRAVEKNTLTISPYYLKQYNNRWFLFGLNHLLKKIQNLALDRILSLSSSSQDFISSDIDFNKYFEDIVGVTKYDLPVEKIKIRLTNNILPYIRSKPLHGSQKISDNILKLELIPNYELESLLLSHGENMTLLEPKELADKIKSRIQAMSNGYASKE